jgi:hypothetical protein
MYIQVDIFTVCCVLSKGYVLKLHVIVFGYAQTLGRKGGWLRNISVVSGRDRLSLVSPSNIV